MAVAERASHAPCQGQLGWEPEAGAGVRGALHSFAGASLGTSPPQPCPGVWTPDTNCPGAWGIHRPHGSAENRSLAPRADLSTVGDVAPALLALGPRAKACSAQPQEEAEPQPPVRWGDPVAEGPLAQGQRMSSRGGVTSGAPISSLSRRGSVGRELKLSSCWVCRESCLDKIQTSTSYITGCCKTNLALC